MKKIELQLQSPLLVGGKKLVGNFVSSLDYISGAVLRAALASDILRSCPLYDIEKPDAEGRYNWVYVRDDDRCKGCKNYKWCSNFGNIRFSFLYLKGTRPFPLSAMKCKYHDDHGLLDVLIYDGERKCLYSNCGDRVEFATGFYDENNHEMVKSKKRMVSRTAVNNYTRTQKDGSLYSLMVLQEGQVFEGYVDGADELEFPGELRVGADTTTGLGKCTVYVSDFTPEDDLSERIRKFNQAIGNSSGKFRKNDSKHSLYISLDFYSDMKPEINREDVGEMKSTDEYKKLWREFLNLGFSYDVIQVYSESNIYRGYDLSKPWDRWRKDPEVIIEKGSVVLIGTDEPLEKVIDKLRQIEKWGIGKETHNGYGQVKVCDEIHLNGR